MVYLFTCALPDEIRLTYLSLAEMGRERVKSSRETAQSKCIILKNSSLDDQTIYLLLCAEGSSKQLEQRETEACKAYNIKVLFLLLQSTAVSASPKVICLSGRKSNNTFLLLLLLFCLFSLPARPSTKEEATQCFPYV